MALPLWTVSYAGVAGNWLAAPLRRLVGGRWWAVLVTLGCLVLLATNGLAFARHQHYLNELRAARDKLIARIPEELLILHVGSAYKLIAVPTESSGYRLRLLEYFGKPAEEPEILFRALRREGRPWYLVALHKTAGAHLVRLHPRGHRPVCAGACVNPLAFPLGLRLPGDAGIRAGDVPAGDIAIRSALRRAKSTGPVAR